MQGNLFKLVLCLVTFISFCSSFQVAHSTRLSKKRLIFDVINYGAAGDGYTDDSKAFNKAWRHLCEGTHHGTPVLKIPERKTFLLKPIRFKGPCKSEHVRVKILGEIVAPDNIDGWKGCKENSWIVFSQVKGLTIIGSGHFDGRGSIWWTRHSSPPSICAWPTALHFERCNGVRLHGTTHSNSPRNHISVTACKKVDLAHLHITAPMHSPNTDGIDISLSTHVHVRDSIIRTGDDCVAISHNSSSINITNTVCGPGHGISIGSLGAFSAYETTKEVFVKNCTFKRTINGLRIKTWEGGSGYAKKITFEDITLEEAWNPIIIDQHYCSLQNGCYRNQSSAVRISDVTYRNVKGSTRSSKAINLECSQSVGCANLVFENINITSSMPERILSAHCENAYGWFSSSSPAPSCLWQSA